MSSITVTVLTPHGRRQNVQVLPHMTLLQILEEVCKKYDFKSEEYCLKHHNKQLDLTQMFRFSGLPNKCFLEMDECTKKREDSDVVICIQLEDGVRHQGQFYPNQTLKDVIEKLCPTFLEEHPIIIYMRAEIYGDELEKKTLKSLGITKGRAMLRLFNKNPEELKNQANVYVPSVKLTTPMSENKLESQLKPEHTDDNENSKIDVKKNKDNFGIISDKIRNVISKEDEKVIVKNEPMGTNEGNKKKDDESVPKKPEYDWGTSVGRTMNDKTVIPKNDEQEDEKMIEEPEIFELGERNAVIFSLDSAQKVVDDIPDSFFDLTVDDIKVLLRDLQKEASGNEDAPLLTAKLREIEESSKQLTKLSQYKKSVIRIQFPDRMVLQGTFSPTDKIEHIHDFVKSYLKNPDLNFYLFTIPPKKVMNRDKTLVEADCIPTAVLHFGVEGDNIGYLKEGLQQTSATGAILAASKSRGLVSNQQQQQQQQQESEAGPSSYRASISSATGAVPKQPRPESFKKSSVSESKEKVPKWFKAIRK